MKRDNWNQLLKEMMWWEYHELFAVPEEERIDLLGNTPEWEKVTLSVWNEIQKEISREEYIEWLLEKVCLQSGRGPIQWIVSFVHYCLENEKKGYHDLFSQTTEKGQEVIENSALARELLNHSLGERWRNKWFSEKQRDVLKNELYVLNKTHEVDDVFSHLISMMPASMSWLDKQDIIMKVSVMMVLLAYSYPEMFVKMDKFLEKQVIVDGMIAWKAFNEMIDELVWYAPALESKNTGAIYNYRVDDLFQFAHEAKEILSQVPALEKITKRRQKKWVNENSHYLEVMYARYEKVQRQFKDWALFGMNDSELYTMFIMLTNQFYAHENYCKNWVFLRSTIEAQISGWDCFEDPKYGEYAKNNDSGLSDVWKRTGLDYLLWLTKIDVDLNIVKSLFIKIQRTVMRSGCTLNTEQKIFYDHCLEMIQSAGDEEMKNTILKSIRTEEQLLLVEWSEWRIKLRIDGKIDFYDEKWEAIALWAEILMPTKLKNFWKVRKTTVMRWWSKGWKTIVCYMNDWEAIKEAKNQKKKFLPPDQIEEKINKIIQTLRSASVQPYEAFQLLFRSEYTWWYDSHPGLYMGDPYFYWRGFMSIIWLDPYKFNILSWNNNEIFQKTSVGDYPYLVFDEI